MGIGFALYPAASALLDQLCDRLEQRGIRIAMRMPGQRLHVSLMNGDGGDAACLATMLQRVGPLPRRIRCTGVRFFERPHAVAYGGIDPDDVAALRALHLMVLSCCDVAQVQVRPAYQPEAWVPHMSLAGRLSPAERTIIIEETAHLPPLELPVVACGVVQWNADMVRTIATWDVP